MSALALTAGVVWLLTLIGLGVVAWVLHGRSQRERSRERHPAGRKRLPWPRRRRLPEQVIAELTDTEWPDLEWRLLSGEVHDPAGERIARQHARNVAEMPELDPQGDNK